MNYTQRMIELNPVLGSILGRCETHIENMIGSKVTLLLEEPFYEDDQLPLWGWLSETHQNRLRYTVKEKDLVRLTYRLCKIWNVSPIYMRSTKRKHDIIVMKQIFALLVRQFYPTLPLLDIGIFMKRSDHSTVIGWLKDAKNLIKNNDSLFMSFYEPVKFIFDADTNS